MPKTSAAYKPDNMPAVTPHLVCAGAVEAIAFYKAAFGATERMRLPGPDGRLLHACVEIAGAPVMLAEEFPQWGSFSPKHLKGSPVVIHIYVPDVDAFIARAVAAGAKVTMPVGDAFWGDRYGQLEDPFGHRWSVATQIGARELTVDEVRAAMIEAMKSGPICAEASSGAAKG